MNFKNTDYVDLHAIEGLEWWERTAADRKHAENFAKELIKRPTNPTGSIYYPHAQPKELNYPFG